MHSPRFGEAPLALLSASLIFESVARGIDLMISPNDSTPALSAISEWASPTVLGAILIILSVAAAVGLIVRSKPVQAISHVGLCALFLVMGAVSSFPIAASVGWGWRAPVAYIFGFGAAHWYLAQSWFNRWVVSGGRADLDS